MIKRKFTCIQGCSDCCIFREYYPSETFGKIGVLLLPDEVPSIEDQARRSGVTVRILPRIAVGRDSPEKIVAYQMMGKNGDGDLCPFLDVESGNQSWHGGFACRIYANRPLACRAYPVVESTSEVKLDEHCKFCREFATTTASANSLQGEVAALNMIKQEMKIADDSLRVWRYATATGKAEDRTKMLQEGWVMES